MKDADAMFALFGFSLDLHTITNVNAASLGLDLTYPWQHERRRCDLGVVWNWLGLPVATWKSQMHFFIKCNDHFLRRSILEILGDSNLALVSLFASLLEPISAPTIWNTSKSSEGKESESMPNCTGTEPQ